MADPIVFRQVLNERTQTHETRKSLFGKLERALGRPVVTFFTSFSYPVRIEDQDADMLQAVLQKADLRKGLAMLVNSPGGDALAAERIINVCRNYSGTGEYWAIVAGKAKSAATMVCFGASRIYMAPTSELGPIDPQIVTTENGKTKWFSVFNLVKSYERIFDKAVKTDGNVQPFLQQLQNYDEREIEEFRTALSLSEDIAVRTLSSGMMKGKSDKEIKKRIEMFLNPTRRTKTHGRPIYKNDANACDIDVVDIDITSDLWKSIYELYIRTDTFVSSDASKCVESKHDSFFAPAGGPS